MLIFFSLKLFRTSWTSADKKLTFQKQQCIKCRQLWQSLLYDVKRANQKRKNEQNLSYFILLLVIFVRLATVQQIRTMCLCGWWIMNLHFCHLGLGYFFMCANCKNGGMQGMENIKDVKIKRSLPPNDCYFLNSLCWRWHYPDKCDSKRTKSWALLLMYSKSLSLFIRFVSFLWSRLNATSTLIFTFCGP